MRKILVISPHFDDAVLSAGQFLAERPDADVVTVFAGMPITPDKVKTPYDTKCGFDNARNAVGARIHENGQALALLQARALNLDFPDSQYENRHANHVYVDQIVDQLQKILALEDYEFIMGPIGLGHPDHIKVAEAITQLNTNLPIYLWEDLPLRVVEPHLVPPRLEALGLTLDKLWQTGTTDEKMAKKVRSMFCYKSQVYTGILDPYVMFVPERFWKYQQ